MGERKQPTGGPPKGTIKPSPPPPPPKRAQQCGRCGAHLIVLNAGLFAYCMDCLRAIVWHWEHCEETRDSRYANWARDQEYPDPDHEW